MAQPSQNPDWAKQMLLNGGVNPLYGPQQPDPSVPQPPPDPQRGSIAAAMPQTPQAPSQPAQPSPVPAPPQRGAISDAMSQPTSAPTQNAPIAGAPAEYKHGTLAKIMLGIGEAVGNPLATRIGQRDREREQEISEYNRPGNVEALQNKANLAQQTTQADLAQKSAQTQYEKTLNDLATQNIPIQEVAQKLHGALVERWQSGVDPDPQAFMQYANEQISAAPGRAGSFVAPHLQAITQLPQQPPSFKGTNTVTYKGKNYGLAPTPNEPPEITAARQSEMGSLHAGELAKLDPIILGQLGTPPTDPAQLSAYMKKAEQVKTRMASAPRINMMMERPTQVADAQGNVTYETAGKAMNEHAMAPGSAQPSAAKALQKSATSGEIGKTLNSFNTASEHLKLLDQLGDALQNGNTQIINKAGNAFSTATGSAAPTNFEMAKNAVAGEIAKTFKGNATEGEIGAINETLNKAMSPAQLKGAIQTALSLMESKRQALRTQYEQGMSGKPAFEGNEGSSGGGGQQAQPKTPTFAEWKKSQQPH